MPDIDALKKQLKDMQAQIESLSKKGWNHLAGLR